ncbi:MAG: GNAT family N-acetyltransferase [Acidimicrobiia bacterium]|nr:GNAT family N-acetyltransferase [Acidimicrobiia bacterium]MBP8181370.1 GNAT family N-acetyltransferase [Acidimicrobiia bacterium]
MVSVTVTEPDSPEALGALTRYFAELDERLPSHLDETERSVENVRRFRAPSGVFAVMSDGDETIGCGALLWLDESTAEVKRMWLDPTRRGRGLGAQLLSALEDFASAADRKRIVLDTHSHLVEAVALYERCGYQRTARYNDNPHCEFWFEKRL